MKIPNVHLIGYAHHAVNETSNPFINNLRDEDALSDIPNFIDWLSEMPAISKLASEATRVDSLTEADQAKTEAASSSAFYTEKTEASKPSETDERSSLDDISPKELTHLLKEALSTSDIQYLKQWVIPNVPIIMGNIPIQQLFPVDETGDISYRGFEVSDNLKSMVAKGIKSGQPIRIELDANASIVLKFKNGRVSAEFLSNEHIAAWAMKQQLETLKQQLLSKNLPVDDLTYRSFSQKQEQREKREEKPRQWLEEQGDISLI
ncbi:MAG: hypothetical protein VKJ04_02205 [Vampirovibrionales bacterium]|nr:hypothetical protein [Vampirovibrionales bacterium]